jgi:hypothetical protein
MTLTVAILALVVSGVGTWYAWRSARASEVSAEAAKASAKSAAAEDRRARTPQIVVTVDARAAHDGDVATYAIRNDGPQDLDSVVVHRPAPPDGIRYPVAATGQTDWQDTAEVGPLGLTQVGHFSLSCGSARKLPTFRVKIVCRAGNDQWELIRELDFPRSPPPPRVVTATIAR